MLLRCVGSRSRVLFSIVCGCGNLFVGNRRFSAVLIRCAWRCKCALGMDTVRIRLCVRGKMWECEVKKLQKFSKELLCGCWCGAAELGCNVSEIYPQVDDSLTSYSDVVAFWI